MQESKICTHPAWPAQHQLPAANPLSFAPSGSRALGHSVGRDSEGLRHRHPVSASSCIFCLSAYRTCNVVIAPPRVLPKYLFGNALRSGSLHVIPRAGRSWHLRPAGAAAGTTTTPGHHRTADAGLDLSRNYLLKTDYLPPFTAVLLSIPLSSVGIFRATMPRSLGSCSDSIRPRDPPPISRFRPCPCPRPHSDCAPVRRLLTHSGINTHETDHPWAVHDKCSFTNTQVAGQSTSFDVAVPPLSATSGGASSIYIGSISTGTRGR